jgi:hypothetical protein
MAILCCAAKNSIRGTATILFQGTEFRVGFSSAEWFGTEFQVFASILFHGTEFRVVFSSTEWFGTEFREFPIPRNSRNSAGTNQLFQRNSVFHGIIFLVGNCQPIVEGYGKWLEGENISLVMREEL